jgi:hypothetical protein
MSQLFMSPTVYLFRERNFHFYIQSERSIFAHSIDYSLLLLSIDEYE